MRVRPRVRSLHTRGLRPQSRERGRAAHAPRRLQIPGLDEALPLGHRIGRHRVVIDPRAALAQATGRKARAMTALSNVPQGTVPARVRPNGPLMLHVILLPAGALRLQCPRTRVRRVLPEDPDVGRLSKVALAFPPATLLELCPDYRIEADPGS